MLITGGARPLLYGSYRTVLDPGDVAVYPVPSWNNNHYAYLCGARAIEIPVRAESNFFPTVDDLRPHLPYARLILLNSPLNPTGTAIDPEVLRAICEAIVEENHRRERAGAKAAWLCYDQVYWQLVFGGAKHVTPPEVCAEVAPYTIILDAASKSFAATGLRVGWAVMPPAARQRMADILGHVGAWAPRPEQVAMAALLDDDAAVDSYLGEMRPRVAERLDRLAAGFAAMRKEGLPVEVIAPQGAIYLSVRFAFPGRTNEETRKLLLDRAGLARGAVSSVRPARRQRLVPDLRRRRLAGGDRRRAAAGPRGARRKLTAPFARSAPARSSSLRWRSCCASASSRSRRTSMATRRCARSSPSGWCSIPPAPPCRAPTASSDRCTRR